MLTPGRERDRSLPPSREGGEGGQREAQCSGPAFSPQYGKKKLKYLPYNHQHEYFFLSECGRTPPRPGGLWPPPIGILRRPGVGPQACQTHAGARRTRSQSSRTTRLPAGLQILSPSSA